jgi:Uma2 family endonuclease
MSQIAKNYFSEEEYLRLEESSVEKHEYYLGEIFLMAGGSERHNLISSNTLGELWSNLRGKNCRTYNSDMRVKAEPNSLHTYPDVSVVCGEPRFAAGRSDTIVNPILIAEILSPSTEKYDRSQKFELYRAINGFEHYLIIDQARVYVEYHHKISPSKWEMEIFEERTQTFKIEGLGIEISLTNLYDKVAFDSPH